MSFDDAHCLVFAHNAHRACYISCVQLTGSGTFIAASRVGGEGRGSNFNTHLGVAVIVLSSFRAFTFHHSVCITQRLFETRYLWLTDTSCA
jgi:hypothetical protein